MEEERRRSVDNATLVELDLMAETVQQLQVDTGAGEWKAAVMAVEALESGALSAAVEAMLAMTPYASEFLGQLLSVMGVRKAEGTGEWHGTDAGGGVRLLDEDATDEGGAAGRVRALFRMVMSMHVQVSMSRELTERLAIPPVETMWRSLGGESRVVARDESLHLQWGLTVIQRMCRNLYDSAHEEIAYAAAMAQERGSFEPNVAQELYVSDALRAIGEVTERVASAIRAEDDYLWMFNGEDEPSPELVERRWTELAEWRSDLFLVETCWVETTAADLAVSCQVAMRTSMDVIDQVRQATSGIRPMARRSDLASVVQRMRMHLQAVETEKRDTQQQEEQR